MQHPFDGILTSSDDQGISRRAALGTIAGVAVAGVAGAAVPPPQVTTQAIGEEGGRPPVVTLAIGEAGGPTTRAIGEEGGNRGVTTEPFGEEAGKVMSRRVPGLEDGRAVLTKRRGENGGGPTTEAVGEEGGPRISTRALGEEGAATKRLGENGGGILTRARNEAGGPSVPVKPASNKLTEQKMESLWKNLAAKSSLQGTQAAAQLYGSTGAVKFLAGQLEPSKLDIPMTDLDKVEKLVKDLDSKRFQVREKAEAALAKMGPEAEAALRDAMKSTKSAEVRMRLQRVIKQLKENPTIRQAQRGLEILVALRSKESRALLEKLSKGEEKQWLTKAAAMALKRAGR